MTESTSLAQPMMASILYLSSVYAITTRHWQHIKP